MKVSIVVPVLNEAQYVRRFLQRARRDPPDEIVLVDGGSDDGTVEIARIAAARDLPLRIERSTSGLARQLNTGAALARGDVLFFPYVDCRLPEGWSAAIRAAMGDPAVAGGAFRLGFDRAGIFRTVAAVANLRTALGLGPLGDQGIFVRRPIFEALGGYREDRLLEDLDFSRRLRTLGEVRVLTPSIETSTRRWRAHGLVRTALTNWFYLGLHFAPAARMWCDRYREYRVRTHD
ncbi:MAG: TIGR04283 family arsenosugar biosynthesis glycosyltransferase [Planctomycetes bacterium]|nr:TIGR04283 family arsenosugar biosynthesis glycosyltransferase [Planctomycetota bacterium]